MPQLKAKASGESNKNESPKARRQRCSESSSVHELITNIISYEEEIRKQVANSSSGRFEMLTKSEREFLRASFVADYIRLAIAKLDDKPDQFDKAVREFSEKISEMQLPSIELIGTFIAAVEFVSEEECLKGIPDLNDALRHTMITVLQSCVEKLREKACLMTAVV